MNLIKLKDLDVIGLEEIKGKLDKKYQKMADENEINKIRELNNNKFEPEPILYHFFAYVTLLNISCGCLLNAQPFKKAPPWEAPVGSHQ